MQTEWQTVKTLIRLLMGLHCLLRPVCPKTKDHYSKMKGMLAVWVTLKICRLGVGGRATSILYENVKSLNVSKW